MAQLTARHRLALMGNAWYAQLSEDLRTTIERLARRKMLAHGELLFHRGQAADAWYGVLSGAIKVRNLNTEGRESVLTYVEPGYWFGEISLFDDLPRAHDGCAHDATEVLCLATEDFSALLKSYPELCIHIMRVQCQRMRLLFGLVEEITTLNTEQRLARQLIGLARNHGRPETDGVLIDLKLPQDELALLLGVSRQSINKILKAWEREGWVLQHYGKITLRNIAALQSQIGLSIY